jgi:uncharacterized protein YqjF (DUF2071 family)
MWSESRQRRPFLTACWTNLFLANYPVPDELLTPGLPLGIELDRRDGSAYVSLVAFDFRDTRVLGISWPGYRRFSEVNLRFYVRRGGERGVVFIRELVPLRLVAWLARVLYNEPYAAMPMTSRVTESDCAITVEHCLTGGDRTHSIWAIGDKPCCRPAPDTTEHFFKEHRWGFGRTRGGRTLRYEVRHDCWDTYPVRDYAIDIDWATLYGPEWAELNKATPSSVVLAGGSAVAVYPHGRVTVERP